MPHNLTEMNGFRHHNENNTKRKNDTSDPKTSESDSKRHKNGDKPFYFNVTEGTRYVVKAKLQSLASNADSYVLICEQRGTEVTAILRDLWAGNSSIKEGTKLGIIDATFDENGCLVVEKGSGLLVVEPDTLVSCTSVTDQLWCGRRSAFTENMRIPWGNAAMLQGIVAHEVLGKAMNENIRTEKGIQEVLNELLRTEGVMQCAYGLGINATELKTMTSSFVQPVLRFMNMRYEVENGVLGNTTILGVQDIEDNYYSPKYGLKGKLDASIKIKKRDGSTKIVPFELKTGRPRVEHSGQTELYNLLIKQRYGDVNTSLLYYLTEDRFTEVIPKIKTLQHLLKMRNDLVIQKHISDGGMQQLKRPTHIEYKRHCQSCQYKHVCSLFLENQIDTKSVPLSTVSDVEHMLLTEGNPHLSEKEKRFFSQWFQFISYEVEEDLKNSSSHAIWNKCDTDRENNGRCISALRPKKFYEDFNIEKTVKGYVICLERQDDDLPPSHRFFNTGDLVVLSVQEEPCIALAKVMEISHESISLFLERRLPSNLNLKNLVCMVDKYPFSSPFMITFNYLLELMKDDQKSKAARDIVIKCKQPSFEKISMGQLQSFSSVPLNNEQRKVILKCLNGDYCLVRGMPGTGKSSTILHLIKEIIGKGSSVLITAYTNTALENILEKVDYDFLRLGNWSSIDKQKQYYEKSSSYITKTSANVDELAQAYDAKHIVGTTLLNLKHEIFRRKVFDYCIVDEAAQASPAAIFGVLKLAKRIIFVGDPDQLPAITKSKVAKQMGLPDNIFSMISTPVNTVKLCEQFRMVPEIMEVSNKLVYNNQMKTKLVANADRLVHHFDPAVFEKATTSLESPFMKAPEWLPIVVDLHKRVIFLDTSEMGSTAKPYGSSVCNEIEAKIVHKIIDTYMHTRIQKRLEGFKKVKLSVGIITPYRGQVWLIEKLLSSVLGEYELPISTVDKFQGQEMDIIICSFVKSSAVSVKECTPEDNPHAGGILTDIRRLNVAITRAKEKLIFIGNMDTLSVFEPFQKLQKVLETSQIYHMAKPDDFHKGDSLFVNP